METSWPLGKDKKLKLKGCMIYLPETTQYAFVRELQPSSLTNASSITSLPLSFQASLSALQQDSL